MGSSLDSYLRDLSYSFYLKKSSTEISKIETSKANLLSNLDNELGTKIKRRFVFGSYDRDTILPRSIDQRSDIDLMVIFNHTDYERTPATYRNWLKDFGDKYYKNRYGSEVIKSFPTVTIRLGNIHFDLVPAKEESLMFHSSIYIPDQLYGWQITDPSDVKDRLTAANTRYNSIVKPIIRLFKAWNSTNGYPFDSYKLELKLLSNSYYGDNVERGFFRAVNQLQSEWSDSQFRKEKIVSLKYNIVKVKENLDNYNTLNAKQWLHRVLPYG